MTAINKESDLSGVYFSPSSLSFIPEAWIHDGTYTEENTPEDLVLLEEIEADEFWRVPPPPGKILGAVDGLPQWVDEPKQDYPSIEQIESNRLREYSNPLSGSDRLFSEASRMQLMSEPGFEDVRIRAIARFEEIQAQHPWPTE